MRSLLLITSLLLLFFQDEMFAQYDNGLKSYVPGTPSGASFAKVAEHNMESFSGASSVMIPITEISDNALKQDVYLTYQQSGIKASETASSVGLGWNLSAGGAITRSVRNAPDEHIFDGQISGYYTHPIDPSWFTNFLDLSRIVAGERDVESDVYFYNFNGYSGSFTFGPGQVIIQKDKNDLRIVPVFTNYAFNKFVWQITTPDGSIYYFGDTNGTDGVADDAVSYSNQYAQPKDMVGAPGRTNPIVDSWYLVKVESFDNTSSLTYEYSKYEAYSFRDIGSNPTGHILENGMNIIGLPPLESANIILCSESLTPRLTKIISDNRVLKFDYQTEVRRDLDNFSTPGFHPRFVVGIPTANITTANALASISVMTPAETLLHKYVLSTDYFRSTADGFLGTLGLAQQTDSYGSYYCDMRRLRLDSIRCLTSTNAVISRHAFEYHSDIIQRRLTYAQDDHGYPNGIVSNTTLLPKLLIDTLAFSEPIIDLTDISSLADRSPDALITQKAALTKVHYPTGGNRSFTYGGHDFYTNSVVESGALIVDMRNPNCSSPAGCPTCCYGDTVTSNVVTFSASPNIRYKMTVKGTRTPQDVSNDNISLLFNVKAGLTGSFQLVDNLVLRASNNYDTTACYREIQLPPSPTGVYQFQIEASTTRRLFMQFTLVEYTRNDVMVNKPVGGLRLASVVDQPLIGPAITTTYDYKTYNNGSASSGYLVGLPTYCEQYLDDDAEYTLLIDPNNPICVPIEWRFNAGNTFAMASTQGSHIGYKRITKTVSSGEGYTEMLYITDPNHRAKYIRNYPALPEYYMDYTSGYLSDSKSYNPLGTLVQHEQRTYFTYDYNNYTPSYAVRRYPLCSNVAYDIIPYIIPSRYIRLDAKSVTKDGNQIGDSYIYADLPAYTRVTQETRNNSNGPNFSTQFQYINTYPFNNTLRDEMIAQHRVYRLADH